MQEPKPKSPPLGLNDHNYNPKRDILMGKHSEFGSTKNRRTLLLTDSILNGIYPQNLSSHKHEVVIKKLCTTSQISLATKMSFSILIASL